MRLIDADAIPCQNEIIADESGYMAEFDIAYKSDIDALPTVEVAPVVCARWKHIGTFSNGAVYECSKCGRVIRAPELRNFPYCHCGAKMWESESDG